MRSRVYFSAPAVIASITGLRVSSAASTMASVISRLSVLKAPTP